ncbi:mitochondrial escape protein 2 [Aspergillus tubingensis]|uniref:Mitochondrial escape protein 2 n=1 Tax=Aspergillus tubingensis TaxID=5068 RepID=A0A9W6AWC4_ASPTU|nr:mitochondrial escape protein 2 [Aspergillus tubingensis]GLA78325.1 mitochondrial escape protein 2 [Aspergillus tubingensis]GLA88131.1 mitochondrial escape protein 2 [Aspergillus tubingensis]
MSGPSETKGQAQPLFSKPSANVKFPVKSIKYNDLEQDRSMAKEIATDPPIHLLLYRTNLRLRQGVSVGDGRDKKDSFWIVNCSLDQIEAVSLDINQVEIIYTFKSTVMPDASPQTTNADTHPKPSTFPLANANLLNKVVQLTLEFPSSRKMWDNNTKLFHEVFMGGRISLSDEEQKYISSNRKAIDNEAEAEHKCLATLGCRVKGVAVGNRILLGIWPKEDRPFRIYRGCNLVLRGKTWFAQQKAKNYIIPGQTGLPEDFMASVTENSAKWTTLIDAPVHAVLLNNVDVRAVKQVDEDDVRVFIVANHMLQVEMQKATRALEEYWGDESFDDACRDCTKQEVATSSDNGPKLSLTSIFLPNTPRANTHDPWGSAPPDLKSLVPNNWRLNSAQTEATIQLLTHSLSLVVGPPGTGKTRTIAAATMFVTQILCGGSVGLAKLAILVPTHAAGAAVMSQLSGAFSKFNYSDKKLIRLRSRADTEARLFADVHGPHDDIDKIINLANKQPRQYQQFLNGIKKLRDSGRLDMSKEQLRKYNGQRRELISRVMEDVQVVVTLPFNVKEMIRRKFNPQFVVFDEASFFRDPDLFHVLGQLRADVRVLLVGDHKQLSPPVFTAAGNAAWSKSAFERLIDKGYSQTLLNISYRSYKDLYEPTSVAYYEGKVDTFRSQPSVDMPITSANPLTVRLGNKTWTLHGLSHFLHLPHIEGDTRKDPSGSLYHAQEAELGICLAQQLLNRRIGSILIMSPYRAQVALVNRLWDQRFSELRPRPRIQTVDASQGSEADVIIVLITRNHGAPGFLHSAKRTNVMLSRARNAQYVIGDWDWLGNKVFKKDAASFFKYLEEAERLVGKDLYSVES